VEYDIIKAVFHVKQLNPAVIISFREKSGKKKRS